MKIYFAGSIRGGRDDASLYTQIIELLRNYGEVLTEHIGDPQLGSFGQVSLTDTKIYQKDIAWVNAADIIVAEVTNPSLGVGYEIGYGEALKKKVIALYRPSEGKRLSAMIAGNQNIIVTNYTDVSELVTVFDRLLK